MMNIKQFYKKDFPEVDDIVMVKINQEDEFGYHGNLVEYENITGFIALSELIKGKYLNKKHILRLGDVLPVSVIRLNKDKNIVDLSKKRVTPTEISTKVHQYKICTNINKLVNECYTMYLKYCDINSSNILYSINDIMASTIWRLYDTCDNYDITYNQVLDNPLLLLPSGLFDEEFISNTYNNINQRIIRKKMIIELEFKLIIIENDALEKIKNIVIVNKDFDDQYKIKIYIQSSPLYKIKVEGYSKTKSLEILDVIKNNILENSKKYTCAIEFGTPNIICETVYEVKFLSDFDLNL